MISESSSLIVLLKINALCIVQSQASENNNLQLEQRHSQSGFIYSTIRVSTNSTVRKSIFFGTFNSDSRFPGQYDVTTTRDRAIPACSGYPGYRVHIKMYARVHI